MGITKLESQNDKLEINMLPTHNFKTWILNGKTKTDIQNEKLKTGNTNDKPEAEKVKMGNSNDNPEAEKSQMGNSNQETKT